MVHHAVMAVHHNTMRASVALCLCPQFSARLRNMRASRWDVPLPWCLLKLSSWALRVSATDQCCRLTISARSGCAHMNSFMGNYSVNKFFDHVSRPAPWGGGQPPRLLCMAHAMFESCPKLVVPCLDSVCHGPNPFRVPSLTAAGGAHLLWRMVPQLHVLCVCVRTDLGGLASSFSVISSSTSVVAGDTASCRPQRCRAILITPIMRSCFEIALIVVSNSLLIYDDV